jgi:hypothetical protein
LCRLLGISAFAGFIVLLAGWPLNSYLSRRSVRIQKGVLAARDKRMGVLNELIGAVCTFSFNIKILYTYMCYHDRSNLSSFLLGKNNGSTKLWILEKLKWNGWLKVE